MGRLSLGWGGCVEVLPRVEEEAGEERQSQRGA